MPFETLLFSQVYLEPTYMRKVYEKKMYIILGSDFDNQMV